MENDSVKSQARKAYEIARIKMALPFGLIVIPLIYLSCVTCGSDKIPLTIGSILLFSVIIFKWRGLAFGKSVMPGLIAGAVAFSIPLLMHILEICCRNNLEVFFCVASGIFGGLVLSRLIVGQKEDRSKVLIFSLCISGLTATLGCASLGISAVFGLLLALIISAVTTNRFFFKKKLK